MSSSRHSLTRMEWTRANRLTSTCSSQEPACKSRSSQRPSLRLSPLTRIDSLTLLRRRTQRTRQSGLLGPSTRCSSLLRHRACLALPLRATRLGPRTPSRIHLVRTAARLARPHLATLRTLARTNALARPRARTRPARQEPRRELPPVRTRRRSRTLSTRRRGILAGTETGHGETSPGEQVGRLYRPVTVACREAQVDQTAPLCRRPRPARARSSPAGRSVPFSSSVQPLSLIRPLSTTEPGISLVDYLQKGFSLSGPIADSLAYALALCTSPSGNAVQQYRGTGFFPALRKESSNPPGNEQIQLFRPWSGYGASSTPSGDTAHRPTSWVTTEVQATSSAGFLGECFTHTRVQNDRVQELPPRTESREPPTHRRRRRRRRTGYVPFGVADRFSDDRSCRSNSNQKSDLPSRRLNLPSRAPRRSRLRPPGWVRPRRRPLGVKKKKDPRRQQQHGRSGSPSVWKKAATRPSLRAIGSFRPLTSSRPCSLPIPLHRRRYKSPRKARPLT